MNLLNKCDKRKEMKKENVGAVETLKTEIK